MDVQWINQWHPEALWYSHCFKPSVILPANGQNPVVLFTHSNQGMNTIQARHFLLILTESSVYTLKLMNSDSSDLALFWRSHVHHNSAYITLVVSD